MTDGIRFLDAPGCVPIESDEPVRAACCGAEVTELVNRAGETRCVGCDAEFAERLGVAEFETMGVLQ